MRGISYLVRRRHFTAKLKRFQGEKVEKFTFTNEKEAHAAQSVLAQQSYHIDTVEKKQTRRHPQPPFTTSTLQQEASRNLGFGASRAMRIAQQLYEGIQLDNETTGLITYMRTDSVALSKEAIQQARQMIQNRFGDPYLPKQPRIYKSKAKNAQEAHEAIRPTNMNLTPQKAAGYLQPEQAKLYELIWKRAVASQMESAIFDQVNADLISEDQKHQFRATGSTPHFDGFLTLYQEGRDEKQKDAFNDDGDTKTLPMLQKGDPAKVKKIEPDQHFTEPPPRYSEASLVKKLEELGIGRPSTYATTLSVLQARDYAILDKKRFHPTEKGLLVTAFLKQFFAQYIEYDFTASLENLLDDISNAKEEWKHVLSEFWTPFSTKVEETSKLPPEDTTKAIQKELHLHFFPDGKSLEDQECPQCKAGQIPPAFQQIWRLFRMYGISRM